jgi:hypothetical protein
VLLSTRPVFLFDRPLATDLENVQKCILKAGHVRRDGRAAVPAQRLSVHLQKGVDVRQRAAPAVQQVAPVRAGLALAGVGPEEKGRVLARLGRLAVQDESGWTTEQGPSAIGWAQCGFDRRSVR